MVLPPKSSAGRALVGVTIAMLALSWMAVITRVWVRRWIKGLGVDDFMMVAGLFLFTIAGGALLSSAYNGVGTPDIFLDPVTVRDGLKWFWVGQVTYCLSTFPIKCSICMAMLRFTRAKRYQIPLYAIIGLALIAAVSAALTLTLWCRPIAANWDSRAGTCPNPIIITNFSYFFSACSITTDWACAILPAFILWDIQLKLRVKISVVGLLAMGVVASSATIVRLAYFTLYTSRENYMYGVSKIAMWSVLECGIGIVAGCIATFRPLMRFIPFISQSSYATKSNPLNGHSHQMTPMGRDAAHGNRSRHDPEEGDGWERSDADSQKHILKETTIELSTAPGGRAS
ncbi:hypothetical protein BKA66DRAFT_35149 [Pyrenochaeta sp. MPI-SDFR-AT-0127]|nr:hypothetical protein BKA66DRAFT_35149 [Pyrenochaeta sp. MPI-SDFR-AT-0127]